MKTLVICPGSDVFEDSLFYLIDPDTGECLATHYCSGAAWAKRDLYYDRPERIEKYTNKFDDQIEIKFIDETGYTEQELLKKNEEFYKE